MVEIALPAPHDGHPGFRSPTDTIIQTGILIVAPLKPHLFSAFSLRFNAGYSGVYLQEIADAFML